jgi:probable HAF family extracellular repeat protein
MNGSGQIAGFSYAAGSSGGYGEGFSWTASGGMVDIGSLGGSHGSDAAAVSDDGEVVGSSYVPGNASYHAVAWTEAGGIVDLGTLSGGHYSIALAVNNSGEIAGLGYLSDDVRAHATLWRISEDATPPTTQCGSADGNWHASDVSISCSASDSGSGLANPADASFSLTTSVAANTETPNASTGTRQVCDMAGNCTTAGPIAGNKIDKKAPLVSCATADGLWHGSDVSLACTTSDAGSGLADSANASFTLSTSVPTGTETASASTGSRVVCDAVGNCSTAGPIDGNKIDKKAPTITVTTPPQNAGYLYKQPVPASYACADGGSGALSCTGTVANGANIPTTTPGAMTFTVNATDNVGNASPTVTRNYTVTFKFQGFSYPQNQPVVNVVQAGRITPARFNLFDYFGVTVYNSLRLAIFVGGSPSSTVVACPSGSTYNVTQTASTTGLRYDTTNRRYEYGFATSSAWAGTCRVLTMKFKDGTQQKLAYKFK